MSDEKEWLNGKGWRAFNAYAWKQNPSKKIAFPDPWGRYAYGFKEAGDRLTQSILEGKPGGIDLLLMPILYLYRHWIELSIKCSIRDLERHLGTHSKMISGHSLSSWTKMLQLAEELSGTPANEFDQATRLVEELMELDPNGESFRYPESLKGMPTWTGPEWINIETLAQGIDHVQSAIYWVEGVLNQADQSHEWAQSISDR